MARFTVWVAMVCALAGCAGSPNAPTYTQAELAERCWRTNGWWRPDNLVGGFCEYEAPNF